MVNRQNGAVKLHAIYLVIAGVFCIACLILSAQIPRIPFDVSVSNASTGNVVVVKRVFFSGDDLQPGDVIEAVAGHPVHSKAELYRFISRENDKVDLSIRRLDGRFQRPVKASDFAHGALPVGLEPDDKPVQIADEFGNYTPLENVDFAALKNILSERDGAVNVVFKKQSESHHAVVFLHDATERTLGASLILIVLCLMGLVAWNTRDQRQLCRQYAMANLSCGLGCMGILALGLWHILPANPLIHLVGLIGLTLFKAVNLDYHLVYFTQRPLIDKWVRVGLYFGPMASLIIPIWLCVGDFPVLWGGAADSSADLRPEAFAFIPMVWAALYTLIDAGLSVVRYRNAEKIQPHDVGNVVSCVLAIMIFALMRSDIQGARWFLMALILIQAVNSILPGLKNDHQPASCRLDDPMFSLAPVRKLLDRAQAAIGENWDIHLVIERPAPRHVVSMVRSDDESAFCGIDLSVLPDPWRDFLELFHIEDGCVNGENNGDSESDPVAGIAEKLGIVMALPIAENVAGTQTCLSFLVSRSLSEINAPSEIHLKQAQREELSEILDELCECAPAMVYHSAEMSLDYLGEDLDAAVGAMVPPAYMMPTMSGLPHGFDEEENDGEMRISPAFSKPASNGEIQMLRSQVMALHTQQFRQCAIMDIELTSDQQAVLEEMAELDPPFLIVGEPGTGKQSIAMSAHQNRSEGPFLQIDAADIPESILELDIFGDGENPGLIQSAAGGALYIENIDRISDRLLDRILSTIQNLPARSSFGLYLSVQVTQDAFSVAQYRSEPDCLPAYIRQLAERCDAELIVLEPLREQADIERVASFFRQKAALRHNRPVEGFDPQAMKALKMYAWPGNYYELRLVIGRAVLRAQGNLITPAALGPEFEDLLQGTAKVRAQVELGERVQKLQSLNESHLHQIDSLNERILELENAQSEADSVDDFLSGSFADIEKRLLAKILEKYQNDPEKAADALALNRARFFSKLSKYQLIDFS